MYSVPEHLGMIEDPVRTRAYISALQRAIQPGASVVEIGTGFGFFAVAACRADAAVVYAIESDDVIQIATQVAQANGCAERIQFIHANSHDVELPPADVLVSDLRGVLPFFGQHIPSIVDARARLLKPGGIQIPERDTLSAALVTQPASAERATVIHDRHGVVLDPVFHVLAHTWRKVRLTEELLLSASYEVHRVDYRTVTSPDFASTIEMTASRDDTAHGVAVWFDTELFDGHGFSNAPHAAPALYGQAFFPFPQPLALAKDDVVSLSLSARLIRDEYVWSWSGRVLTGGQAGIEFSQSTFFATPLVPDALRKAADHHVPTLTRKALAHAWILNAMTGTSTLGDIAEQALAQFPDQFSDYQQALAKVADLSREFSE